MYEYEELYGKAIAENSTAEDRVGLFRWMERYDMRSWNGEEFSLRNGRSLRPVYNTIFDEDGEIYEIEVIDAVIA